MSPVIEAEGVGKNWGDVIALHPTDLTVYSGELVALVGHNGAGKTTLLALLAGVLESTSGAVKICGNATGSIEARRALSYIPDLPVFYDDLSLIEHIEYVARLHNTPDWMPRSKELLERLSLSDRADDLPSRFSRGMKQRASVILGLIRPMQVLLADEPTTALDAGSRKEMLKLLEEARSDGSAVVVSAHQPELFDIAERCLALREGAKIYDGRLEMGSLPELMT